MIAKRTLLRPAWPLLACLTVAVSWPASQGWGGSAYGNLAGLHGVVEVGPGWVGVTVSPDRGSRLHDESRWSADLGWLAGPRRRAMAYPRVWSSPGQYRFYSPLWVATAAAGVFAASLLGSRWRHRGPAAGRCRQCGYDLRATPDRCPECGAVAGQGVVATQVPGQAGV